VNGLNLLCKVSIEQVSIARPMLSERDKVATKRQIYPSEVNVVQC
jgi:hypothetical protein